jgi:murein DD-endopeptidase MepM/ murein hydrolase activator NlpD
MSVLLAARAEAAGAAIDKVSFRAQWPEVQPPGAWAVLCEATRVDSSEILGCEYDFSPIPAREFRLAFDVSDRAGNVTFSPDGERRLGRRFSLSEALQLPVRGAVQVDGFRPTDCDAGQGDHCGLELYAADLVSDRGPVYPVAPGTAVFAGGTCEIPQIEWGATCLGNTIILSHGEGIYSIYARLEGIAPWQGWPRATYDTEMALMGDSGCRGSCTPATPHLHFSMRRGPEGLTGERILWEADQPINIWELLPELIAAGP